MKIINDLLKILPLEMTEGEFIALILSVSIILGTFGACHNEAKRCERSLRELREKENSASSAETDKEVD